MGATATQAKSLVYRLSLSPLILRMANVNDHILFSKKNWNYCIISEDFQQKNNISSKNKNDWMDNTKRQMCDGSGIMVTRNITSTPHQYVT